MHTIRQDQMYVEDIPVRLIAESVGTPVYVYSRHAIESAVDDFQHSFASVPHTLCYAVKASSNLALLRLAASRGCGADVVSGGELYRARLAGFPGDRIVFSGVGKTPAEMRQALEEDILLFQVESIAELETLHEVAASLGRTPRVSLRLNPDIDARTHPYIATGLRSHKFGLPMEQATEYYRHAARCPNLEVAGVHVHLGSQILSPDPYLEALDRIRELLRALREEGIAIRYLDIGGGMGIRYREETPLSPAMLARAILPVLRELGCTLLLEPGRSIVGASGMLVTRVLYLKRRDGKTFVIVDAGMNDLIRPSLYQAYHEILPVTQRVRAETLSDVVGPVCESGDFFCLDRMLPVVEAGELLAILDAGAYGFAMASNYNSRPRPPEVLVSGSEFFLIRERETYADLVRGESIPELLLHGSSRSPRE